MDESRVQRLREFVEWTRQHITGDEKGQGQIFLDRLFRAFGHAGVAEAGAILEKRVSQHHRETDSRTTTFADLVWKPVVLIEMKKRGEDLRRHFRQTFDYWISLVPNRPAYAVLCNFDEFWIYDFNQDIYEPQDQLTLAELPDRFAPLAFLFPTKETPRFKDNRLEVTQKAADLLAETYNRLKNRRDVGPETAQRFILQMLIALFSEDIKLLPEHFVTNLLDECTDPPKAFDLLGGLFHAMNTPGGTTGGRYKGVPYFNGGIFSIPAPVELDPDYELAWLKKAASYNWNKISPDIFGTIFQHSMDDAERHKYGGHYTTPTDIMKIVGPTIVHPWRAAIAKAKNLPQLRALQQRLYSFKVLDPACGSGNFLYIAYRELKRLEAELIERITEASGKGERQQQAFGFVTSKQFYGLDIVPFAVELAKVTLTLAHKLAIDELHVDEQALPLDNLDANIQCVDALIEFDATKSPGTPVPGPKPGKPKAGKSAGVPQLLRTPWPAADVIIGNPPFLGAKRLKPERGADYINAVRAAYPDVPGMADYCVYWIYRAHLHLGDCTPEDPFKGRAGLVGTQNIRNNQSRVGGLDHVVKSGVIVEAVDNQPWSGEANVHVSIANWVKKRPAPPQVAGTEAESEAAYEAKLLIPAKRKLWQKVEASLPMFDGPPEARGRKATTVTSKRGKVRKDKSFELAWRDVESINSALSDDVEVSSARKLNCNAEPHRVYQGVTPGHDGFVLTTAKRTKLIDDDAESADVIYTYITGDDLLNDSNAPDRFLIDFAQADLLQSQRFRSAFSHVKKKVLPDIQRKAQDEHASESARRLHLERWWMLWRSRSELIEGFRHLSGRFVACSRVTKRPIFVFLSTSLRPSDKVQSFLMDDDYSFGILQSNSHWQWFVAKCSKLTERLSYSTESVFETFPWPQGNKFTGPTKKQVRAVAEAGREVRRIRAEALPNIKGGLRALYRTLELPGKHPLKDAHAALDAAVLDAYGFTAPPKGDLLKQLLDLNLTAAKRIERGEDVVSPGVPPGFGDASELITDDCIKPG